MAVVALAFLTRAVQQRKAAGERWSPPREALVQVSAVVRGIGDNQYRHGGFVYRVRTTEGEEKEIGLPDAYAPRTWLKLLCSERSGSRRLRVYSVVPCPQDCRKEWTLSHGGPPIDGTPPRGATSSQLSH